MKILNIIALALLIVGGLNWGMYGLFGLDLVAAMFGGPGSVISTTVYTLVGLAALYSLFLLKPISYTDSQDQTLAHR